MLNFFTEYDKYWVETLNFFNKYTRCEHVLYIQVCLKGGVMSHRNCFNCVVVMKWWPSPLLVSVCLQILSSCAGISWMHPVRLLYDNVVFLCSCSAIVPYSTKFCRLFLCCSTDSQKPIKFMNYTVPNIFHRLVFGFSTRLCYQAYYYYCYRCAALEFSRLFSLSKVWPA